MGDHEGWALPNGLLPNGLLPNEASSMTRALDSERWSKAEQKTAELIACIQPNQPSEEHRNAVANYVQRLITECFACQVFTFGSVPLKTYLPDGDIDLTAMSENETLKDTWAIKVSDMLKNEEKNEKAEFRVKEVQYIQAEVKIVKCLVENIVVDISFNQVGGLCTLCFLEEIDHLISQNHLFKRSIILIKAWCYYESRILGAHHGLISTYALETLVLYIFHVYNNTFAGPLEVLYRFLEFFSHFDWANFCVSLWGPVPTGSLPDMTAAPPRKDSGELLLSRLFLQACSAVYAVFPVGQETLGQSFVSKHFNVIDPLRTNNNLGRSVSKGNFFRIRSAFSFGAKRLARLLECPKENLIAEVDKFFTNTWERHGTGNRPDAPNPKLWQAQSIKTSPLDESNNSRKPANMKKNIENGVVRTGHQHHTEGHFTSQGSSSQVHNSISQYSQNAYSTSNSSVAPRSQSQRRVNSGDSGRFQFARTQSSPELTESSAEVLSRLAIKTAVETGKKQIASTEHGNRRNNLGSDVSGGQSAKSSIEDPSSLRHSSSHHSFEAGADSNSYHDDPGFATTGEEFASVSEAFEMQQEEQDLVNMMASSRVHNYNGPVQFPMHLASPQLSLASVGYSQRNFSATVPNNILQFNQGFVSTPLSHYFPITYRDDKAESVNGSSEMAEVSPEGSDVGVWHEYDAGSTRGFDHDSEGFQVLHSDDKSSLGVFNLVPSPRGSNSSNSTIRSQHESSNSSIRSQQEFSRGSARDDYSDAARYPTRRGSDMRYLPVSQASSSRSTVKAREKWGARQSWNSWKPKGGWQFEGSSDNVSSHEEDDSSDWVTSAEGVTGSVSMPNPDTRSQFSGYESSTTSGPDSIIPITLGGSSRPRMVNSSGGFPIAFYPTGPPVPFLTMVPVYNLQSDSKGRDEREQSRITQNSDSIESIDQAEAPTTSVAVMNSNPEHKPDILNSDFASHWQNLQYGRFCQNTRNHGPLAYPSPAMAPPVYAPSRAIPSNIVYGPRLVPVMPLQPGPNRPSGLLQHYGDESPRFRGGTGTYLPSHKASFRDRQYSNTRNHRGSYSYDRNEHSDREGSWISSKAKAAARNNGRNQAEKPGLRLDRTDRSWKREPVASHESSSQSSPNITYSVYPIPNGGGQTGAVVMLYPYDQGVGYGPPSDALEFGSLGPVRLSGANEAPAQGVTSPDQPSSPRVQRSTGRRNYQLRDEDFPPLPFPDNEEGGGDGNYNNRSTHHRASFFNSRHS